jgi:hypothetical protein
MRSSRPPRRKPRKGADQVACPYCWCEDICGREGSDSPALRFGPQDAYNAVMDAYSKNRFVLDMDPYLLAEYLIDEGYLLTSPLVDVVIGAQDLIRAVERS